MATKMHLCYTPLQGSAAQKMDSMFGISGSMIEVNPGKVLLSSKFSEIGDRILDMKVREDDVWLVSLPRTGSTWTQEMVWLIGNDLDYEKAKVIQHLRTPLLELSSVLVNENTFMDSYGDSVKFVENLESIRYIKSHLPLHLLPREIHEVKPKLVYVARNPKDMCVSYYHYLHLVHDLNTNFNEFCELFLNDKTPTAPVWDHVLSFWEKRNDPNVLFLKYEDIKRDQIGHIRKIAEFLGKSLTDDQINELANYTSFSSMKKNKAVNIEPILDELRGKNHMEKVGIDFIRKGQVGDWKNYMSEEMSQRFDKWTEENLKGTGLNFN